MWLASIMTTSIRLMKMSKSEGSIAEPDRQNFIAAACHAYLRHSFGRAFRAERADFLRLCMYPRVAVTRRDSRRLPSFASFH